jgi:hypothetical protein
VVPALGRVRLAVHGGRQALRGDGALRADRREDPQVAGELLAVLPAVRVGAVGDHADHDLLPVGVRDPRGGAQHGVVGDLHRAVRDRRAALLGGRRRRQRR